MDIFLILFPIKQILFSFKHTLKIYDRLLAPYHWKRITIIFSGLLIAWFIYVPIHELFHVAGCILTGGQVNELALSPQYGAHFLKHIFPFIVPESDYAGQLTGFSTPNYWSYAVTDLMPYLISLPGVAMLEWARRKKAAWCFGMAVILVYIPVMAIPGDFYETVSLITTQIGEALSPAAQSGYLVSDDIFKLGSHLVTARPLDIISIALFITGILAAGYAAFLFIALEVLIAQKIFPGLKQKNTPD